MTRVFISLSPERALPSDGSGQLVSSPAPRQSQPHCWSTELPVLRTLPQASGARLVLVPSLRCPLHPSSDPAFLQPPRFSLGLPGPCCPPVRQHSAWDAPPREVLAARGWGARRPPRFPSRSPLWSPPQHSLAATRHTHVQDWLSSSLPDNLE